MSPIIRLTDRSRTETDWTCERERFYLTEYGGRGIVRATTQKELDFGTDIHAALEELARRTGEADVVGDLAPRLYAKVLRREHDRLGADRARELAAIAEGMFRGYCAVVWPQVLQLYDIIAVEPECLKALTGSLSFMSRPDLILRRKSDGTYWYWEYKTTGQRVDDWLKQWPKAVQLHSGCLAAEETLGLKIEGCIVQGLSKGYEKDGHFRSPFCEGWRFLGGGPITFAYTYMRSKGWERFFTAEHPDGISGWGEEMPADLLEKQFPRTQPIYPRADLCERFFAQLVQRETAIASAIANIKLISDSARSDADKSKLIDRIMDDVFPMKFKACSGRYGKFDCPLLEACWNPRVGSDPLGSGLYIQREPHHQPERELLGLP